MFVTQNDEILNHLRTNTGITTAEAFSKYGITRLSARIFDLREKGYDISSLDREEINRNGKKSRFTEYRLTGASR